jgi:TRAP-type C4-dicarboxylate transport system substrate-binding protein
LESFKLHVVTKYHRDAALGGDAAMVFIGRKRYDALPAKAKEAIDRNSYLPLARKLGEKTQEQWEKSRNLVKDSVVTLSTEQEAEWRKRVSPIAVEWAQSVPDGTKVLEAFRAAVAAQRAQK